MKKKPDNVLNAFQKFIDKKGKSDDLTQHEAELLFSEFIQDYEQNVLTPQRKNAAETACSSNDFLELAKLTLDPKEAVPYAKKALALDPMNFEAEIILASAKSVNKGIDYFLKDLASRVEKATIKLDALGYFSKEKIGDFWLIFETRPYMRLRLNYIQALIQTGRINLAKKECEELLRLCEMDNLGVRYTLMHIFAYLEDEEGAKGLLARYSDESSLLMLLPLSLLYYKLNDFAKAEMYLKQVAKDNKNAKEFFSTILENGTEHYLGMELDSYILGSMDEFVVAVNDHHFCYVTVTPFFEWALHTLKGNRKKK